MSTQGTGTAELVELDYDTPEGERLFRLGHEHVERAAARLLLGDRSTSRTADEYLATYRTGTAYRIRTGVLLLDGHPIGTWGHSLPQHDNLSTATIEVIVAPEHRRQGHGTRMLGHVERLVAEAGRTVVHSWQTLPIEDPANPGPPDPTSAFAARHGYVSALPSVRSDLDLVDAPAGGPDDAPDLTVALGALDAEVGAYRDRIEREYRLLTWWDRVPDEWLVDRAHLMTRMSTDAPLGDMEAEEERWDGERVRDVERVSLAQGRATVETVAVHVPSGRLVAFTQLSVPRERPRSCYQWDTLVLREHRGLRLGMRIKAVNLRALVAQYPQVRRITTFNAESNAPMLRVNRAMGFRPISKETCFQKTL